MFIYSYKNEKNCMSHFQRYSIYIDLTYGNGVMIKYHTKKIIKKKEIFYLKYVFDKLICGE